MKKYLFSYLILFVVTVAYSHTYKPLLKDGNRWNVLYKPYGAQLKCGFSTSMMDSIGTQFLKISSDTTFIDGVAYRELSSTYASLNHSWRNEGYISEDTIAQKVYFISYYCEKTLLYDFSLKEGDNVAIGYGLIYTVEEIDSVSIGNQWHKRIRFTDGWGAVNKMEWIEGIGASNGLISNTIPLLDCGTVYDRMLLCFYNNDSMVYQPDDLKQFNCYHETVFVSGYDELKTLQSQSPFQVYPNPVTDQLHVCTDSQKPADIEIVDLQGKVILQQELMNQSNTVKLQGLKSGTYLVRVKSNSDVFTYTIIKE